MSSFTFNRALFAGACADLREAIKTGARSAVQKTIDQAVIDAREMAAWNEDGSDQQETYGDGDTWEWHVSGLARESIQGYVVPDKQLAARATTFTTSRHNGQPLIHPHATTDSVTGDYANDPNKVVGVVTMNAAYAPFLQEWETTAGGQQVPVTVQVFSLNWDGYYAPRIITPELEQHMEAVARKYR